MFQCQNLHLTHLTQSSILSKLVGKNIVLNLFAYSPSNFKLGLTQFVGLITNENVDFFFI